MKAYFESTAQNGTLVFKVIHQEKENSVVVGHAEIDINGKEIKISRLLISKAHRGKGFGEKMIAALILYIQNNLEYAEICLTVFTFNKAVKLYEKMGFEKVDIEEGFMSYEGASWDRLTMKLQVQ